MGWGDIPWLPSGDCKDSVIKSATKFITEEGLKNSSAKLMPINTVVIALTGATTGKVGILNIEASANQSVTGIVPNEKFVPQYIFYYLRSIREKILNDSYGGAQKHISQGYVKDIQVLLPSLESQMKIVEVLEKVEKSLEKGREAIKLLNELVKSKFIEMFGDPKDNSKGWEVKKLGEIFKVGSSKRIYQSEQTASGVPFLRISNLVQRIETGSNSSELYISEEQYNSFKEKSLVPLAGDILVTSQGTLGLCYIVQESDRFYFQDGMISWLKQGNMDVNSIYITNLFGMKGFRKQIDEIPVGTTVNYLSISRLADLDVMYPNIGLQEQFADFVNQIDKLKFEMQKSLEEMENNFNSLMQRAFKGKLFN